MSDPQTAVAIETGAGLQAPPGNRGAASPIAIGVERVWKTFRLPHDRPSTLKQRVLHPRQSRAATQLHALRDVSFQVDTGEFFGIIGRNGSGKSTMLMCLAGIYQPDRGTISVSGRISPFIELGVGFNPELTARDNVVVNAALLGMSRSEALARFPEIIRFAELERFVDLKLKNYSSGMQVRLGFASAIQAEADIYLVDEVLAVGDARFQEKCFDVFRSMKRSGKTVVYVTHDLDTVERFCDRVILLDQGQIVAEGEPRRVTMDYRDRNLDMERSEHSEESSPKADVDTDRWGDRSVEIVEAWFEGDDGTRIDVARQNELVVFRSRIRFNAAHEAPVFGVVIKTEDGHPLFVTNTLDERIDVGSFGPGDEVVYSVRFEARIGGGAHAASPAVAYQDRQRFADWREDLVTLRIDARRAGGLAALPHETSLERCT